jgi:hypothetical protein
LAEDTDRATTPSSPAGHIAGLIAANATLVVGVLVYMGWAYDTAFLGYFHLSPLDLDVGVSEYILRSLDLFSPALIVGAVVIIALFSMRPWAAVGAWVARRAGHADVVTEGEEGAVPPDVAQAPDIAELGMPDALGGRAVHPTPRLARLTRTLVSADDDVRRRTSRMLLTWSGFAITGIALLLVWAANYVSISTYLVLALLAAGPLMLTWPVRRRTTGRFPYALAVVVAAVCTLWATSLYAQGVGTGDAQAVVHGLPSRTAVALYSTERLGLNGPGLTVVQLPPGAAYHYEYLGLRLLLHRSDTYYLLPVDWYRGADATYVIEDSDMIRIVLYSADVVVRSAAVPGK